MILEHEPPKSVFNDSFKLSKIDHDKEPSDARPEKLDELRRKWAGKIDRQTLNFLNSLQEELGGQQFFRKEPSDRGRFNV